MPDDELSPEQERVRALLAQARVDTPVPDDVAARLDRVLAQLAEGGPEEGSEAPTAVVDLASRRRRKAATLLVAAAAVVAVGFGIGTVVPDATEDSASDSGAVAPADTAAGVQDRPGEDFAAESAPEASASRLVADTPARVRPDHFANDVARLRVTPADGAEQTSPDELESTYTDGASAFMCDAAAWGPGRLVAVHYAGVPAVLAFRPATGDTQVVDLLECGTAAILRSVTLPAR